MTNEEKETIKKELLGLDAKQTSFLLWFLLGYCAEDERVWKGVSSWLEYYNKKARADK